MNGRISDNRLIQRYLHWQPDTNPTHRVMTRLSKSADSVDKDQWIR